VHIARHHPFRSYNLPTISNVGTSSRSTCKRAQWILKDRRPTRQRLQRKALVIRSTAAAKSLPRRPPSSQRRPQDQRTLQVGTKGSPHAHPQALVRCRGAGRRWALHWQHGSFQPPPPPPPPPSRRSPNSPASCLPPSSPSSQGEGCSRGSGKGSAACSAGAA
jgi:hypothetical protein